MADKESIIVAIELGTSRIAGVAGKKKDGNLQILAYAEERASGIVKRGAVYNIDKTTQSIRNVVLKLEDTLKKKVAQAYVGIGGQSVRSVRCKVPFDLRTSSYITAEHIDSMRSDSYEVTLPDYELIENFPQGFVVDSAAVDDPVGIMGTKIEGEYLNVIARRKLKANIETCFSNTNVRIADFRLAAYELAKNVLTDQEKRAGCALVNLGAGTTTVAVYRNNIMRHLVTIPLGLDNINQDLNNVLNVELDEAEKLKKQYANAFPEDAKAEEEDEEPKTYTTSFGQQVKVIEIENTIEARLREILDNVKAQIRNTNYDQLLAGIVLTGGGCHIKNIEKAVRNLGLDIDKVRIANSIIDPVVKNSTITRLDVADPESTTIISLLASGTEDCTADQYQGNDIFTEEENQQTIAERQRLREQAEAVENEMLQKLEQYKDAIRKRLSEVEIKTREVREDGKDKKLRRRADEFAAQARDILDAGYDACVATLGEKDKHKQTLNEASSLVEELDKAIDTLKATVKKAKDDNSFMRRMRDFLDDVVDD